MASISLDRIWIHNAATPAEFVMSYSDRPTDTRDVPGAVRTYAGGRRRAIVQAGRWHDIAVQLIDVTDADLARLDSWMGAVVMYRDQRGRLIFGSYFDLSPADHADGSGWAVGVSIRQVTHPIEVL